MGKGFTPDSQHARRTRSGQRTKLTVARAERLIELLAKGVYISTAAYSAGVHPSTVHTWMAAGARLEEEERDDYTEDEELLIWFAWEARAAMANSQIEDWDRLLALSGPGLPGAISAIQWRLERRFPEQFAKRQVIIDSEENLKSEIDLTKLSDQQLLDLERLVEAAQVEQKPDKP